MKLIINTVRAYEIDSLYHFKGKLICDGCDTEILESEQIFAIYYKLENRVAFIYHTHNTQDCLKPWIVNNLEYALS